MCIRDRYIAALGSLELASSNLYSVPSVILFTLPSANVKIVFFALTTYIGALSLQVISVSANSKYTFSSSVEFTITCPSSKVPCRQYVPPEFIVIVLPSTVVPVSYTHLDVYKRQLLM